MKKMLAILLMVGLAAPVYGAELAQVKTPVLIAQQQSKTKQSQKQSQPKKKNVIQRTIDKLKQKREQRKHNNQTPTKNIGVRG